MKAFFLTTLISFSFIAQAQKVVNWDYNAKKIADKTYEIHITARIIQPWHIYSQTTPQGGPVPTRINFVKNPLIMTTSSIKEIGKLEKKHEDVFGIDVKYFNNSVDFVQQVKLKANVKTNITGTVQYMACNDQQCLPPTTISFNIPIQ